ncbi:HRDC domain-containing protein [Phycicoccus sp. Soil748]|uniref:HRDC domain-containing protein n=1 Tax=Phycicoccus sp. Soil748 TaxID=1736397 RepID=UPI000ACA2460
MTDTDAEASAVDPAAPEASLLLPPDSRDGTVVDSSEVSQDGAPADATVALDMPADGVPPVVQTERGLLEAAAAIAAGEGPVALDAERASGYRYGQRAYLVQLRREGSGTWLIDPIACPDLSPVNEAIGNAEWILHAATQDLACLAEVGLRPRQLFDTELAGRLLGLPRVGLAAVVEHYLGLSLAKEHSAVDWSTRPLPEPWLRYAALDVEVLVEVRNLMGVDLARQAKDGWAREEFEALLDFTGPAPRVDPWRRTSGMHKVRQRRTAAVVRELWEARDAIAQERDVSPGRVLPDAVLVEIAMAAPTSVDTLPSGHRSVRRYQRQWLDAVNRANAIPEADLPPMTLRSDGPPPQRAWPERDPVAAARLADTREALTAFATERAIPVENVLSPEPLRRVIWSPPHDRSAAGFAQALQGLGARRWQTDIVAPMVAAAFAAHPDE